MNMVILHGTLGADPELRNTTSDKSVCNFSIATSESWTDKQGQKQEKTEWHRIQCWGKLAMAANNHLEKGSKVFIEGSLATRSYEDNQGNKRFVTEVVAKKIEFLTGKREESGSDPF